jgi:dTDP-4-amino-4,6-dideoxygalactose transaminase
VPWFDGRGSFRAEWPDIAEQLHRVFDRDKFADGTLTVELEEAVSRYTGAARAVGVNSGSDALYLILCAAGVGAGDEVVVPAFAPASTMAAVRRARATPVPVDVEAGSPVLAADAVAPALSARTRAVVAVHRYARMPDMAALRRITAAAGVTLVEDATEAMGTRRHGVHAGLFGAAGALSFAAGTTLGALGDAGMVVTDDAELARRCVMLRHHGRTGEVPGRSSDVSSPAASTGTNSKMDEVQAAVLLARLASFDSAVARRRAVAARYTERLAGTAGLQLPDLPEHQVWPAYVMAADDRDALADHLARAGVQTEVPARLSIADRPGDFPAAEAAAARLIALPVHPGLGAGDVDHVCDAVTGFYERRRR